jgi:hypothetical protein
MSTIVIPGGEDPLGRPLASYAVGAEHTVFEWCMIYTDGHPTAFLGDDSRRATRKLQNIRLTLLGVRGSNEPAGRPHPTETDKGVWDDPATYRTRNAVYQELAEGIASGRFVAKLVYLDDRPSTLDLTLCILDAAPVLAIAQHRKDHGELIARLLDCGAAPVVPGVTRERSSSRRGAYKSALELFLAMKPLSILQRTTPAALASGFKLHCEQEQTEVLSVLPKRLRSMEPLIERIVDSRIAAAKTQAEQNKDRQQPRRARKSQ